METFLDFVHSSGTVRNANDDRYADFGHFLKMWKRLYKEIETFPHFMILPIFENVETSLYFLILPIFENVDTSVYRNVSTFLDFVYF